MKRIFVFCMIAFLFVALAGAQTKMKLKFADGSEIEKLVRDVESITFAEVVPLVITEHSVPQESITNSAARLDFTVDGYYDNRSEVGVIYSTDKSEVETGETANISGKITGSSMFFELGSLQQMTTYYYKLYVQNDGFDRFYTEVGEFVTSDKPAVPEFVDLGLSVRWATRNIGAPEGEITHVGGLYVWGDPTGKLTISSNLSDLYYVDNNISGTKYDIATAQWGENWRMPTTAELQELSTLEVRRENNYENSGVGGFVFKGKNGKEIFFPSSGYINSAGFHGNYAYTYYWSSEKSGSPSNVCFANLNYSGANITETAYSVVMLPVRAVYIGEDPAEHDGETDAGKQVKRVNLGFAFDWADRNVGAASETDFGKYYAWGETEDKNDYQLTTYKWLNEDYGGDPTKAYKNIGSNLSKSEYDVAALDWGGNWRMPTSEEMTQLLESCQWTWTYKNGVAGYNVTRNGYSGSLFIPAGGYMHGTASMNKGTDVYYWTSSLHGLRDDAAYDLEKRGTSPVLSHFSRDKGMLIRPVRDRD